MKVTKEKNCYCHNCKKWFHYLGIASHRTRNKNDNEDVTITYTNGDTCTYKYSQKSE